MSSDSEISALSEDSQFFYTEYLLQIDEDFVPLNYRLFAHQFVNKYYCYGRNLAFEIDSSFIILNKNQVDFPYYCSQYCDGFQIKKQPHYYEIVRYKNLILAHIGPYIYQLDRLNVTIFHHFENYEAELPHNRLCTYQDKLYFTNNGQISEYVNNNFIVAQCVQKEARLYSYNNNFIIRESSKSFRIFQNKTCVFLSSENVWYDTHLNGLFFFHDESTKIHFIIDLRDKISVYQLSNGVIIDYEIYFTAGKWAISQRCLNIILNLKLVNGSQLVSLIYSRHQTNYKNQLELLQDTTRQQTDINTTLFDNYSVVQLCYQNDTLHLLYQYLTKYELQLAFNQNFCEYAINQNLSLIPKLFQLFNLPQEAIDIILPVLIINNLLTPDILLKIPIKSSFSFVFKSFDQFSDNQDFVSKYLEIIIKYPNIRHLILQIIENHNLFFLQQLYPHTVNDTYYDYEDSPAELCMTSGFYEGLSYIAQFHPQPLYSNGESILMKALMLEDTKSITLLLHQSQTSDREGKNPLFYASQLPHLKLIFPLIKTHQDKNGQTALMLSIIQNRDNIAHFLSAVEQNYIDSQSRCALFYALKHHKWHIARRLMGEISHVKIHQLAQIQLSQSMFNGLVGECFAGSAQKEQIFTVLLETNRFDGYCDQFGRFRGLFQEVNFVQGEWRGQDVFGRGQGEYSLLLKLYQGRYNYSELNVIFE